MAGWVCLCRAAVFFLLSKSLAFQFIKSISETARELMGLVGSSLGQMDERQTLADLMSVSMRSGEWMSRGWLAGIRGRVPGYLGLLDGRVHWQTGLGKVLGSVMYSTA
ncbi:hypothetical protein BJ166DRAFT_497864 [Pestalotiopsis sp. NC0098]|nr:hypothetical protein BJ166DRAFT_497864 [Pestalotiopsis sp. NC0098]